MFFTIIAGCSCNTANPDSSEQSPLSTSEKVSWFEQEHTVTLHSYFDPSVRKAEAEDILTRINAAYLSLENGETSENSADIYYRLTCGSMCSPLWIGMKGVILEDVGDLKPSFEECVQVLSNSEGNVDGYNSLLTTYGSYACIKTKNGKVGWIRYEQDFLSNLGAGNSQITYWVWDKVFSDPR